MSRHGSELRGERSVPASSLPAGRFGRMFRELPAALHSDAALRALAQAMLVDGPEEDNSILFPDSQENYDIPAGYTYLGQFIDHDLTFDPVSSLERSTDPNALVDFRTPRFDLDSVYGRGPDEQPYMYDPDRVKLVQGIAGDLPRAAMNDRAIIGDPRNDENRIVSQLHALFIRFHNRAVDVLSATGLRKKALFLEAQRQTRWHYQWMVVHDFLKRIAGASVVDALIHLEDYSAGGAPDQSPGKYWPEHLKFFRWKHSPYMPVEFSGAVYRFGHSMVRPSYHLNAAEILVRDKFEIHGKGNTTPFRVPIFASSEPNLNGFRSLPVVAGGYSLEIDWRLFFQDVGDLQIDIPHRGPKKIPPQPSYKIDTKVVEPLTLLDVAGAVDPDPGRPHMHNLAFRNLKRGVSLGLPSGQDVARRMGITPLRDLWREAEISDERKQQFTSNSIPLPSDLGELVQGILALDYLNEENGNISRARARAKAEVTHLETHTPLWFYILREGEKQLARNPNPRDQGSSGGARLGPVGGRIVAEVFIGLLWGDNESYLSMDPLWTPRQGMLNLPDDMTAGHFVRFAIGQ